MKTAHHRPARAFWQRGKAFLTAAIECLNGINGLLVFAATLLLAFIAWRTDRTVRDTLVAANRAWVTPASAFVDAPVIGKTLVFHVRYGNPGKEPATDFVAQEDSDEIDAPAPQASLYTILPRNRLQDVCARTHAATEGGVVYPAREDYTFTAITERLITPEIQSGSKLIVVHGCFAYQTFHRERKSEYCFIFLNAAHGDMQGVHCPFGNTAD
jgi:hypothetical protein